MAHYTTVPNAVDAFTRFMVEAFDEKQIIGVPTGFQAFFGQNAASKTRFYPDSNDVDIDIMKGNERLAAIVPRGLVSRPLGPNQEDTSSQQFTNFNRTFPLVEEEGNIDANQQLFRLAGESPAAQRKKIDRVRQLAMDHCEEHVRRIVRLNEYLASQAILTGIMPAGQGTQFDFLRDANLTTSVPVSWLDDTNAIPMDDIEDMCLEIRKIGHMTADMMLFAGDSLRAFVNHSTIKELADNRRINLVKVGSENPPPPRFNRFLEAGFLCRNMLETPEGWQLWMFTYPEVYTNSAGVATRYIPDGNVLICSSEARCDRYFGPGERNPITPVEMQWFQQLFGISMDRPPMPVNVKGGNSIVPLEQFYIDAYEPANKKSITIRTQSAPIWAPVQSNAFGLLEDTTAALP